MTTLELTSLRSAFSGTLVLPGDHGYDDARSVFNGMIDRHSVRAPQAAPRSASASSTPR